MSEPNTDPTGGIRRAEGIEASAPLNETFANYVQSSAFTLSLSRNMIGALLRLHDSIENGDYKRSIGVHEGATQALIRRGLCNVESQPRRYCAGVDRKNPKWSEIAEITTAGKLVIQLLAEAGIAPRLISPMPPPPPGWTDPRPRVDISLEHGTRLLPSRREMSEAGTTPEMGSEQ